MELILIIIFSNNRTLSPHIFKPITIYSEMLSEVHKN